MPEIAEVRLVSDYINEVSRGQRCSGITKSQVHKGLDLEPWYNDNCSWGISKLSSEARGKELHVIMSHPQDTNLSLRVRFNLGMSGHFVLHDTTTRPKHAHITFSLNYDDQLSFVDPRRFGTWKPIQTWHPNRGPDVITSPALVKQHMEKLLMHKDRLKSAPAMLLNQFWFNGIGNYLRSDLLYILDVSPTWTIEQVIAHHGVDHFVDVMAGLCIQMYQVGGGRLQSFKTPGLEYQKLTKFYCYSQRGMCHVYDPSGRRLWFHPKWKEQVAMAWPTKTIGEKA